MDKYSVTCKMSVSIINFFKEVYIKHNNSKGAF